MKTEIKYALIYVFASFIWDCIEYAAGLHSARIDIHPYFVTPFFIILTIGIFIFAIREKRQEPGGNITFVKAFITGMIITFLIILFNPFFLYAYSHYVNIDFYNAFIQYEVRSGKSTLKEAEEYYNFLNFVVRGSLYRLIMGLLAALLVSIFIKKSSRNTIKEAELSAKSGF